MPASSRKRQKRRSQDLVPRLEKRIHVKAAQQNADYVGDEGLSSADKVDEICRECRKIDFEGIFGEDLRSEKLYKLWGNRLFALPHIHPQSKCPTCRFFYHTRLLPSDGAKVDLYMLRVFPVKDALGAWQLDIDNSPGFAVVPINDLEQYPDMKRYEASGGVVMELSDDRHAFSGRRIHPRLDISLLKGWLEFCDNNHRTLCKKSDPQSPLGFRVIDCSTRRIVLWETVAHPKTYVTLSYVWGSQIEDTIIFQDSLPKTLTATIDDAILLTTLLGYQYLWIDRYCIPQHNPTEKKLQLQSMNIIYQQSICTIIAAAGDDPCYGLPGVGSRPRKDQPHVRIGSRTLISTPHVKKAILQSKWNSRGWTYQEGLLSTRKLVLTDTQVYFQCNSMHCLESIYAPLEILHTLKNNRMRDHVDMCRVFPLHGLGTYPKHLEDRLDDYLRRSLTFQKDIIDAFRGILNAFEHQFSSPVKSLCGIPLFCKDTSNIESRILIFGLLWRSVRHKVQNKPKRRLEFPSWTWAGWELSKITLLCTGSWHNIAMLQRLESLVDVSVEYPGGLVLPWSGNQDQILAQDALGTSPALLHIFGPTLDIQICSDGSILSSEHDDRIMEQATEREFGSRHRLKTSVRDIRSAYNLEKKEDRPLSCTFLIMGHSKFEISLILLYQPENSLYFERIDSYDISKRSLSLDLAPSTELTIPESLKGWTEREVLIG